MIRESKKPRLDMVTVCVVGSGARELAIIRALKRSSRCSAVRCFGAESNDAIAELAGAVEVGDEASPAAVLAFCKSGKTDLAIIGPTAALAAGVVDMLLENGIQAVGAHKAATAVANKDFARNLMKQFNIHACIPEDDSAGTGQEFSIMSFCDGTTCIHLPPMHSCLLAYVGNSGPTTDGMGCFSGGGRHNGLLPFLEEPDVSRASRVNECMMRALTKTTGAPFKGVLQGNFRCEVAGVSCTSFGAGFGETETINALALMQSDILDIFEAMAASMLKPDLVTVNTALACVVKVLAPFGFPEKPLVGETIDISGVEDASRLLLHCADRPAPGKLATKAERLAAIVATGTTLAEAEKTCESEVRRISGSVFHRPDIASASMVATAVAVQRSLRKIRIGVVGSTRGSSLQPILYAIQDGRLNAEIAVVVGNVATSYILQRARVNNIKAVHIPGKGRVREEFDRDVTKALEEAQVDVVLLVGFMRIISDEFCKRWVGRLLNVHPSLLPLHAGLMDLQVHQSVIDAGDKESGCTVHQVIEEVDGGEVVVQMRVDVVAGETAHSLKAKVQQLEGESLIRACEMFYHDRTLPGATDAAAAKARLDGSDGMDQS